MDDHNFLLLLKQRFPYLYDVEQHVRKISETTGYGQVSINLRVASKKVDKIDIMYEFSNKYIKRADL